MVPTVRSLARYALSSLAVLSLVGFSVTARAADEAQSGKRWALGFTHGPLKITTVADGSGKTSSYHYMTLKVENKTSYPRTWLPHMVGTTDTPHAPYLAIGFPLALETIRRAENDPTLQSLDASQWGDDKKARRIAVGETLNLVAIFGPLDPLYDRFKISFEGLVNPVTIVKVLKYGEKQEVVLEAAYDERNRKVMDEVKKAAAASSSAIPAPTEEYQEVVEKRAFVMEYQRLGDEFHANDNPIDFVREGWLVVSSDLVRVIGAANK